MDLAHPVLLRFAERTWGLSPAELLRGQVPPSDPRCAPPVARETPAYERRTVTLGALAAQLAEPAEHLASKLSVALLPVGHVGIHELAARAGVDLPEARRALQRELAPAVTRAGWIDLGHERVLAYMAAHPFACDRAGEPVVPLIDGSGYLAGAELGAEGVDLDHPFTRCFVARRLGRVPTDAELARWAAEEEP